MMEGKELLGVPLRESFREVVGQQIIDRYEECYRTGEVQTAKEWRTVIDPGGGREPFEIFIDFLLYPWRDANGGVRGVVASATDVTGSVARRRGAERAQQVAEERYRDAVAVVTELQEALLPEALPVPPGLDVAAWYLLAAQGSAAGGDWFDAVVRPDGRVALVVGDVVGHGVRASAVMGQLRTVLHQQLLGATTVIAALEALDSFARVVPDAHAATVCVVEYDPSDGTMSYCTAGHPPPAVIAVDGAARFLAPTGSMPLATGGSFTTARERLLPRPGHPRSVVTSAARENITDVKELGARQGCRRRPVPEATSGGRHGAQRPSRHPDQARAGDEDSARHRAHRRHRDPPGPRAHR